MPTKPTILEREIVAKSRLFQIERVKLQFSNGEVRDYERLCGTGRKAVMMVPVLDAETCLLVREYAGGVDRYELSFPKGAIDEGEDMYEAANRELKEEVGYGANQFRLLREMTSAPGYSGSVMPVVLTYDLYPEKLIGDEPEPIEVIPWKISEIDKLLMQEDFTEARSIAALFLLKEQLDQGLF